MANRTYRYIDFEPAYPFGYGLTYGDCSVVSAKAERDADYVTVTATLRNGGDTDTGEVLQVYAQNFDTGFATPNPRLIGFKRSFCPHGEEITVKAGIPAERLKVINAQGESRFEGRVTLYVGLGQPDGQTQRLTGHPSVEIPLG